MLSLTDNTTLLGATKEQYASILERMSYANMHILSLEADCFAPLLGVRPYNKKAVDEAFKNLTAEIDVIFESYLTKHTYLVGERITLADLFAATMFVKGYLYLFGSQWRSEHPALTRWFSTIIANPIFGGKFDDFKYTEEMIKFVPPKKEEKPKAAKKEEKPKAAPAADEEDDKPQEKKAAHPLAALGKSKMVLDDFKRVYSNEDTPKALAWFWEHYDPTEWSLYKVDYKYNDELTLTFMSNNLVGGFFNRLSASTKYMFGCCVVAGENNDNGIVGAFLVRGQDYAPAFDVAPDWESYEYTKLDASNPADKALVEDLWTWEKPVPINGTLKPVADGKVFK